MCDPFGGGDQGDAAAAAEARRQAQIRESVRAINRAFGSPGRAEQIEDIAANQEALNLDELGQQREDAAQQLRFSLARRGLAGGSADVHETGEVEERYNEGVQRASQLGQQAADEVRLEDQRAKQQLISQAQGGLSTGDAARLALQTAQSNIERGTQDAAVANLGDVFRGLNDALVAREAQAGRTAARRLFRTDPYKSLSPTSGTPGTVTSIG